ncbi:MAG: hypothetical protein IKM33_03705 [Clostridia bacterium]|nr:hypothetical protein [Clostridia bacterium]
MENKIVSKPKKRWTAMDTVVVLLVLVAVAGLVYRVIYAARKDLAAESTPYRVYFEVLETHKDVLAEVKGFDAVYLCEDEIRLGYIGVYQDKATGEYTPALTVSPAEEMNHVTATGILVCNNATPAPGGGLRVEDSGRYLTPGGVLEVRTDRAILTIRITSIREHS